VNDGSFISISSFRQLLYEVEMDHSPAERVHRETWMSNEMIRCYKLDLLCWYVVYGMTRAGKSTYAIMSLATAAKRVGEKVNWDFIDRRVVFDIDEILAYFRMAQDRKHNGDGKDIGVVFDDAGVHLHAYKAFHERKFVERISSLLQVAGVYTANIVITTPSPDFVLRMIRVMDEMKLVLVARRSKTTSIATIYSLKFYPPRKLMTRKIVREEFNLDMPYIDRYMKKRMAYTDQQITMLKEYLKGQVKQSIDEEIRRMTGGDAEGEQGQQ
jgi:hypothetical protein